MFGGQFWQQLLDEGDRFFHLIGLDQHQVARVHASQRHFDRDHLASSFENAVRLHPFAQGQALSHQANNFAIGSTASALVFVEDHFIECVRDQFGLVDNIFITAIAGGQTRTVTFQTKIA